MSRRIIVLILVLMVVFAGSLSAQERSEKDTASDFDIGVVLNYSYADLRDQNFESYIPTVRFQMNVLSWLGFSATGYARGQDYVAFVLEAVLRVPLGWIEPYFATGPGYMMAFNNESSESGTSNIAYNIRTGFDIRITDWFSLGPGITLLIPDVSDFFNNLSNLDIQYLKETCLIGFGGKLRF